MRERDIQIQIMLALGACADVRIFRNVVTLAHVGKVIKRWPGGRIMLDHAQTIQAGLLVGSADLVGWKSQEILPQHVGQVWARWLSAEVKTDSGRPSPEQITWRENVLRAGGIAGVVRSVAEAESLLL